MAKKKKIQETKIKQKTKTKKKKKKKKSSPVPKKKKKYEEKIELIKSPPPNQSVYLPEHYYSSNLSLFNILELLFYALFNTSSDKHSVGLSGSRYRFLSYIN